MAFPTTPLDLRIELDIAGTWTNIETPGNNAYQRAGTSPPVVITRGRPDESSSVNPSSASFEVNNRTGNWSPQNPLGAWYGSLGRNTPCRISVPSQINYLRAEDTTQTTGAACPSVTVTGDTEIQLDLQLTNWQACVLAAHWKSSSDKTWALLLNGDGTLSLTYWDGTTVYTSTSTLPLPVRHRFAVKATLQLNDGSGNHVVTFYTSTAIGGTWTILGTAITVAGTISSLFASTAGIEVGYSYGYTVTDPHPGWNTGMCGRIFEFRLLSGIGGTLKADPVFSAQTAGIGAFNDAQGNNWIFGGSGEISSRDYRYHGETSSLPPKWDRSATDLYEPVTAGGLLRRIGQRSGALQSPMRRYYTVSTAPVLADYWPMEDASGSTSLANLTPGFPVNFTGTPKLASSSAFPGSSALPVSNSAQFSAAVSYAGTWSAIDIRFLLDLPSSEATSTMAAVVGTTGTFASIQLLYTSVGSLNLNGFDAGGSLLFAIGPITGANVPLAVQILVTASGGNVTAAYNAQAVGGASVISGGSFTQAGSLGRPHGVQLNPNGGLVNTVFGHLAVLPGNTAISALNSYVCGDGTTTGPLNGWAGEQAAVRYGRLAAEESFQVRIIGPPKTSAAMGVQSSLSLPAMLQECEDADRGQQYEPRAVLGLGYRTLASMLNQAAAVSLDYSLAQLGGTSASTLLEPVYDDRYLMNDITVTRGGGGTAGSSYEYALNDGSAMSISNPPTGIGDYPGNITVSVETDGQLRDEAGWMVHMGTVNEARWPVIPVNLARTAVTSQYYTLTGVDVGDYVSLVNLLTAVTYDPVKQIAYQCKESLGGYFHEIEWSCGPESPYEVGIFDDAVYGRADTDGSTLASSATSSATTLSVATTSSTTPLWTTAAGDFPFDIAVSGERMTVTNITGSSSPQSFTVTRSVNGVIKAQASGADVRLWFPPVYSLA